MSEEDGDFDGEVQTKKKVSGKKLVLFIILPIVLLGGLAGAAVAFGLLDSLLGGGEQHAEEAMQHEEHPAEEAIAPAGVFFPMEEMTVSLSSKTSSKRSYLVLEVELELEDDAAVTVVEQRRPKIVSEFTVFLRELRPEELSGSEGAYLVREELFRRVSQVMAPTPVKDLLLVKMLVQ